MSVRSRHAKDGLRRVSGTRQAIYALATLTPAEHMVAAEAVAKSGKAPMRSALNKLRGTVVGRQ
jgi:hypothetical protein